MQRLSDILRGAGLLRGREPGDAHREGQIVDLEQVRAKLALAAPDSLAPDGLPMCATCRGVRFLRPDVEPEDPRFGHPVRCPSCLEIIRPSLLAARARRANIGETQRRKTFESFLPSSGAAEAFYAAQTFAEDPDGWLVIHGEGGSGKTHLGLAVVNALIDAEVDVAWWYAPDLVGEAKRRIATNEHHELLARLKAVPVLVLDDLGAARPTEFVLADMWEPLFDARYRNRLPTLITLIGSPAEVKELLLESLGRRMEDPTVCRAVWNRAPQFRFEAQS